MDKSVKITKKEFTSLLDELSEYTDNFIQYNGVETDSDEIIPDKVIQLVFINYYIILYIYLYSAMTLGIIRPDELRLKWVFEKTYIKIWLYK